MPTTYSPKPKGLKLPKHTQWWGSGVRVRVQVPAPLIKQVGQREFTHPLDVPPIFSRIEHAARPHIERFFRLIDAARPVPKLNPAIEYGMVIGVGLDQVRRIDRKHQMDQLQEVINVDDIPLADAIEVVNSEDVIGLWRAYQENHVPKHKAVIRKRSIMRQLFEHFMIAPLREFEDPVDGKTYAAFDMTRLSGEQLQRYKETMKDDKGKAFDHLSQIRALYQVAADNGRFKKLPGGNPAAELKVPPKPKGAKWEPYTEDEARDILEAARTGEPAIRWTHWLSCFTGTIVSEIADRKVSDFKVIDGIDVLDIPEGKTEYRPRTLPLHSALRREGFFDYLERIRRQYGADAPLFPDVVPNPAGLRSPSVANRCRTFVRNPDGLGITDPSKQLNGWRKRYATQLEGMEGLGKDHPDRQRYLCGHSGQDVHAKAYLRHPPHKTKPFIDKLTDPTVPRVEAEAA
jgi:integrase